MKGDSQPVLTNTTLEGLHTLKLPGMARGLLEQREHPDYDALGFEERLSMLLDRELTDRANRRLDRMLKAAHLRLSASVEGIDYSRPRGLERAQILSLAESHWVASHHSILIVAATGLGKTYLSCALANAAVRRGHSALYLRGPRLNDEIALARADGRLPRLMAALGPHRRNPHRRLPAQTPRPRPSRRPARGHRGPRRRPLHHRHQPAARHHVARGAR
jgi:DNA replication protein DnaC